MGVINKYESFSWQGWQQRQDPVGALWLIAAFQGKPGQEKG